MRELDDDACELQFPSMISGVKGREECGNDMQLPSQLGTVPEP